MASIRRGLSSAMLLAFATVLLVVPGVQAASSPAEARNPIANSRVPLAAWAGTLSAIARDQANPSVPAREYGVQSGLDPLSYCGNCKAWVDWYGGAGAGSTRLPRNELLSIACDYGGCDRVEVALWAKDNAGSYVEGGFWLTPDSLVGGTFYQYFWAYYTATAGYNYFPIQQIFQDDMTDYLDVRASSLPKNQAFKVDIRP